MDIKQHIILHKKNHEKIDYKIYTNCQNIMKKKPQTQKCHNTIGNMCKIITT